MKRFAYSSGCGFLVESICALILVIGSAFFGPPTSDYLLIIFKVLHTPSRLLRGLIFGPSTHKIFFARCRISVRLAMGLLHRGHLLRDFPDKALPEPA